MALKVGKGSGRFGGYAGWYVECPDCGCSEECDSRADARELADLFETCEPCRAARIAAADELEDVDA